MTRIILYGIAAVLGVLYAIFPKWFLSKKYPNGEVSESAVKTARILGVVVAVVGAAMAAVSAAQL